MELDRLLRDIQAELEPERAPAPLLGEARAVDDDPRAAHDGAAAADDDPPAAHDAPDPEDEPAPAPAVAPPREPPIQALTVLSARLLASTRELLDGYEQMLVGRPAPQPARRAARTRPDSPDVTLTAAPFASLEALREFEHAVSGLPGVREVVIRGYEGTDRAIIEVRLDQRNP